MGLTSNKVRRLWLPALIILGVIVTLSLLMSSLIYPNNIRGNSPQTINLITATASPTSTIVITLAATATQPSNPGASPTQVSTSVVNCTYTTTYWRLNPQTWLIENVVIGNHSFTKAEAIALLEANNTDEKSALLQQFFAALLNTLKGADSGEIESALIAASDWISGHPEGAEISEADRQQAILFAQTLFEYNIGGLGPGHCPDEPVTPTPTPTATATATLTPTITPIRTLVTPSATSEDRKPTESGPGPTAAPTEPAAPTNTPKPQPTNTPRPPMPTPTRAPTEAPPTEQPPASP